MEKEINGLEGNDFCIMLHPKAGGRSKGTRIVWGNGLGSFDIFSAYDLKPAMIPADSRS